MSFADSTGVIVFFECAWCGRVAMFLQSVFEIIDAHTHTHTQTHTHTTTADAPVRDVECRTPFCDHRTAY